MDLSACQRIESAALNAWPALQHLHYDGWVLRFSNGYTRRANSVNALYPGQLPVTEKISYCEQVYRQLQLPAIFRLTPLSPPDLDQQLAARGYQRIDPTLVLGLDLMAWQPPELQANELQILGLDPWLGVYDRVSASVAARRALHAAILHAIIPETLPAALTWQGQWATCGLGVLEHGYFGLFDIVTQASLRRQGLGSQLVGGMLAWAQEQGAQYSYLQVMEDNQAARRLYARLGYTALYGYWYRVRG